jgi:hypothetical protein
LIKKGLHWKTVEAFVYIKFGHLPRKRKTAIQRAKMPGRIPQMAPPRLTLQSLVAGNM